MSRATGIWSLFRPQGRGTKGDGCMVDIWVVKYMGKTDNAYHDFAPHRVASRVEVGLLGTQLDVPRPCTTPTVPRPCAADALVRAD